MTTLYTTINTTEIYRDADTIVTYVIATDAHGITWRWYEQACLVDGIVIETDRFGIRAIDDPPKVETPA
jgi:hypothetical protein